MYTTGVGLGDEKPQADPQVLGGKGAGLVQMVAMGLPVPPGFVIGTAAGRAYLEHLQLPAGLVEEVGTRMSTLALLTGRQFGHDHDPMLVSVRSGAPVSMPGMMDTVLNVGLTWIGTENLARRTGDPRFAWTCFERLLDAFARTVRGVSGGDIEESLLDLAPEADPGVAARARCAAILKLIDGTSDSPFPKPDGQLIEAVEAVFRSWHSPRAKAYRAHKGISDDMGTAVVVQCMVFGNRDENSGSGVAFTRDPSTGDRGAYGDFLFLAQGEDVVSGEHDTLPLSAIATRLPHVATQLAELLRSLETHTRDLCDVEFTIESGRLYVLQTRVGQRSGRAAVRLAVDLVDEGRISEAEAVARVSDDHLKAANGPRFATEPVLETLIAQGLAASPGAAVGTLAFDAERAQHLSGSGANVVLLRPTTSPVDLPGVLASVALVTGRGGRTSHAAVVARGLHRPAVCGVGDVVVAESRRSATLNGRTLHEGDVVFVDGDRGLLGLGHRQLQPARDNDPHLDRFLGWRTNAGAELTHQESHS